LGLPIAALMSIQKELFADVLHAHEPRETLFLNHLLVGVVTDRATHADLAPIVFGILRAIAHAYILHTIGKLDETTARKLMQRLTEERLTDGNRTIKDELVVFAGEQSVTVDVVEWIRNSWKESSDQNPKEFADDILDDFMTTLW